MHTRSVVAYLALSLCGAVIARSQEIPPPPPGEGIFAPPTQPQQLDSRETASEDFDIQTRGPLHEAFAEQYQANPAPGLLIVKRPPQGIDELPPNIKPEGPDVIWIPGYWAWDDENEDFLWISGIWRRPPPAHQWAPGYWATVEGGWRWVSGFWAREGENIVYRDPPPESRDEQMIVDTGADDQFWIPGSWQWQDDQHVWNNGYYAPCQENWVWVPARWRWTPRGYISLAGYWDFRPTVRAMLFAPVVFRPGVLLRPRFVYTPRVVVNPWIALNHFWIRPGYGHYYFGNYYAANYSQWGFHPYANYFRHAGNWDPIFCYYQGFYRRQGVDFHARINSWNSYYLAHADLRPPLNWNSQQEFARHHRGTNILQTSIITTPIADFAAGAKARFPLVTIDDRVRIALGQADSRMTKQLLAHRELAERGKLDAAAAGKASDLVNWSMPKIALPKEAQDLRFAGTPLNGLVKRDGDSKPAPRKLSDAQRNPNSPPRETGKVVEQDPAIEAARKAKQAEMDLIRQRFGNDPVRFQQEMDRLMSRRIGEQPSTSVRKQPITPDAGPGSSFQGSGRTGGLGSPDFRLLPRSSGGNSTPKSDSGSVDRKPLSMLPVGPVGGSLGLPKKDATHSIGNSNRGSIDRKPVSMTPVGPTGGSLRAPKKDATHAIGNLNSGAIDRKSVSMPPVGPVGGSLGAPKKDATHSIGSSNRRVGDSGLGSTPFKGDNGAGQIRSGKTVSRVGQGPIGDGGPANLGGRLGRK